MNTFSSLNHDQKKAKVLAMLEIIGEHNTQAKQLYDFITTSATISEDFLVTIYTLYMTVAENAHKALQADKEASYTKSLKKVQSMIDEDQTSADSYLAQAM